MPLARNIAAWSRCLAILFAGLLLSRAETEAPPMTSLGEIRSLSSETATLGQAIEVTGTVVGIEPESPWNFFLHDGSAGCFVKNAAKDLSTPVKPGDLVRVTGRSDALGYYPSIRDGVVTHLGQGELPKPAKPTAAELFSPEMDSEWVEVPAVIIGYEASPSRFTLSLQVHGLPFKAELPTSPDAEDKAAALMQRPVRLKGVIGTIFNRQRQMTDRHFFVASFAAITPTPRLADEGIPPLLSVGTLLSSGYGPLSRVRIRGIVTQHATDGFYLRDSSGSTLVQAATIRRFPPGTEVEAEGFGAIAPFRPLLRATRVSPLGSKKAIAPIPFGFQSDPAALQAELVTLDADFLGLRSSSIEDILQFRSGDRFFEALRPSDSSRIDLPLHVGDRVRLTGICELTTTHALPRLNWVDGFRIRLPDSSGLEILDRAPWWTTRRLLIALGITGILAVIGITGTWVLRRQVSRQLHVITRKLRAETIGEERDRMARELHDTLEQQLSGIALQLDGLDDAVTRDPAAASRALNLARRMLRYTRLEAHRSVWDLRSKLLEDHGLPAALEVIATSLRSDQAPDIRISLSGEARHLPPGTEFHLLRIAQEAITNAIKHASTLSIQITLDYRADEVRLSIEDDGLGFESSNTQPGHEPHFGLLGMRERAAKIGAQLDIVSSPGNGCQVRVSVPIADPHETQTHPHPAR
ncbi:MAG: sensor histidine kinase [Verrucomicrobia bacterium]|nr:MAG: sensor histidine kinase [Verrucomicrobiota bacterium]TAE89299.1 MAG: sensor histidine kinase [Verrucomicrobiota bacterium]TAF27827.1 MAG: sensor histidine kinase [Verrucomicrobiota bacterium]TAF42676.1 MAG: sensor histidine kinase [Verrucomicrobiota bacterium]